MDIRLTLRAYAMLSVHEDGMGIDHEELIRKRHNA